MIMCRANNILNTQVSMRPLHLLDLIPAVISLESLRFLGENDYEYEVFS